MAYQALQDWPLLSLISSTFPSFTYSLWKSLVLLEHDRPTLMSGPLCGLISLTSPQCLKQCPAHRRHALNRCWINKAATGKLTSCAELELCTKYFTNFQVLICLGPLLTELGLCPLTANKKPPSSFLNSFFQSTPNPTPLRPADPGVVRHSEVLKKDYYYY